MLRFTIVLDYRGGTYVSQCSAKSPADAFRQWVTSDALDEVEQLGPGRRREIAERVRDELRPPVPLTGLVNVWCTGLPIPGGLVNIIKTVS
jgi:hypothetical protein